MSRSVPEWIGKTDDTPPSQACMRRIVERQARCCAITGRPFTPKDRPQFDHVVPLWLGGKNCESNLQAILNDPHAVKTAAEAKVRAKVYANASKHLGIKRPKQTIPSPPKAPKRAPKLDFTARRNPYNREEIL